MLFQTAMTELVSFSRVNGALTTNSSLVAYYVPVKDSEKEMPTFTISKANSMYSVARVEFFSQGAAPSMTFTVGEVSSIIWRYDFVRRELSQCNRLWTTKENNM